MNETEMKIIADWKYEGVYAQYDMMPYEEMQKKHFAFANPENHYYTFYEGTEIAGFINLYEEETRVFFGIGAAPQMCSHGYGVQMCRQAVQIASQEFPGKPLYLEVRTWNERAIRCYEKAGFVKVPGIIEQETYAGKGEFVQMISK
jgi:RimJ/RimL family protein N-acetyltransferase